MTITFVRNLHDAAMKFLSILTSYKIAILAAATWLASVGILDGWMWLSLAILVVSERAFVKWMDAFPSGTIRTRAADGDDGRNTTTPNP